MHGTYLEGIRQALHEEMSADARVMVLGEDVGRYGGAFKVTEGLLDAFGAQRVIDTPLAEAAVIGAAAGAAMAGMLPVAELQFIDFLSCAGFDALVNVAAKSRYRTGVGCPMVLRGPAGGGGRAGPFHSSYPDVWTASTPGLKVVCPATAWDAKVLLKASIRDPDPVVFLEHKFLYRRIRGELPDATVAETLGHAQVRRPGNDLTLISYGAPVHTALAAAESLAEENIDAQVLDLRCLVPLDEDAILNAVRSTHRVVIIHEHPERGGVAGEMMALINEKVFDHLDAPPKRVAGANTPVPYAPTLEDAYLPQVDDVKQAARELVAY